MRAALACLMGIQSRACLLFFFSSRRRHTRFDCDWSSDVCSSDLGPGGKTGATATAVCSVSDTPPTLLMCLNRRSQTNPAVVENGVFCVNTLGDGGAEIADIFAGRTGVTGSDRFTVGEWTTLSTGSPVLVPAVIAFDCRIIEVRSVGSRHHRLHCAMRGPRARDHRARLSLSAGCDRWLGDDLHRGRGRGHG